MTTKTTLPAAAKSGYIPSLDGWRTFSILGVMLAHEVPLRIGGYSNQRLQSVGGMGVALFFAISGVLITTRILEEEEAKGFFDIRRFYIRRLFRIQPAAMVYLTAIALLMLGHVVHDRWRYWTASVFMVENFAWRPSVISVSFFEGHFWSLAVEEHFYILLSLALLCLRRFRFTALSLAWSVFFLVNKYAIAHKLFDPEITGRRTYWQIDYLLLAAMAAVALHRHNVRAWARRYWRPWVAFGVTAIAVGLHRWRIHTHDLSLDAFSLNGWLDEVGFVSRFFFVLWVVATMLHPGSLTTKLLELPPMRYVGRLSYSLYLWHVLFFFRFEPVTQITNPVLLALSGHPAKYIASFTAAVLSYYLVEKPMMRLGHRLAPPVTPGRPDLVEEVKPVLA